MSFREKSALVMGLLMLVCGLWYLRLALATLGMPHGPLATFVPYTMAVIVGSILVQAVLAILSPREAQAAADERERAVIDRAGHWSGVVLGFGAVVGALDYLWRGNGDLLFHLVIGSLIASQLVEYTLQFVLMRRGV